MLALVDCNNFFASSEIVFNPKLEQRALVILSNNDGCIIARCAKAKKMGIKMGDPAYLYQGIKEVTMLSSNFSLYADMSHRVMQTLSSFSPDMEIYSIDEAFFLLSESETLYSQAISMRNKVKKWTGIPVSIGIAPTKTLAKLASEIAKKQEGVHIVRSENLKDLLALTAPSDIWGIGKGLGDRLKKKGIHTALQLSLADDVWIKKTLGLTGFRTVLELRGTSCYELTETPEIKKSIVCSRSFGKKVQCINELHEAVASFATNAAKKLRSQRSLTSFISVFAKSGEESTSCQIHIPQPTSYTPDLIALAKEGISRIFREGTTYHKAGVLLENFSHEDAVQTDLLVSPNLDPKKAKAMQILDQINKRFDKASIRFAAEGTDLSSWKSKRDHTTAHFTTKWSDLLKVNSG